MGVGGGVWAPTLVEAQRGGGVIRPLSRCLAGGVMCPLSRCLAGGVMCPLFRSTLDRPRERRDGKVEVQRYIADVISRPCLTSCSSYHRCS
jgi:hypothetical protein